MSPRNRPKAPPYLNALRAFEASARHQSFAAAAAELNVTPAAVGQLVRSLEQWIQVELFVRSTSGRTRLVPTEAAQRALPDIRAGFDRLSAGLDQLREQGTSRVLTVAVSPAFAAKWLLPRIDRFQADCPDTDVRLDTNLKPVDFIAQRIDVGVRYGQGHWPGLVADKLMEEEVYPVCSPALQRALRSQRRVSHPGDLAQATLIHDQSMDEQTGFPSWDGWLSAVGASHVRATRGMKINNSAAVLQAAIEGQGVALARSVMADDDVRSGRLVRLFPKIEYRSPLAYYIVYRAEQADRSSLRAFREWLLREAGGSLRGP